MNKTILLTLLLVLAAIPAQAQTPTAEEVPKGESDKSPSDLNKDVSSVDNIIHALYEVISGPKGAQVDLERWNKLFVEGAILAPTGIRPSGEHVIQVTTPKKYMAEVFNGGVMPWNFYEVETDRTGDSFGAVTQIFSTYESRQNPTDVEPFDRGINSIQLFNDGNRWWIVSVFWDRERSDLPVPSRYDG